MRPYVGSTGACTISRNHDYAVDMVGHYLKHIQLYLLAYLGGSGPFFKHSQPEAVEDHCTVHDLTKKTRPILFANGNEIGPCLRVVIIPQANGTAAAVVAVNVHIGWGQGRHVGLPLRLGVFICQRCICSNGAYILTLPYGRDNVCASYRPATFVPMLA